MTFPSSDFNGQACLLDDPDAITRDSLWTTRYGKKVAVKDMTDRHLLNTINVLRNRSPIGTWWAGEPWRRRMWLNVMANEAYWRGLSLDAPTEGEPIHE